MAYKSNNPIDAYSNSSTAGNNPGPFLARVINHLDKDYMGGLEVEVLMNSGNTSSQNFVTQVKMMTPFYGVTSEKHLGNTQEYGDTQKSYGMWFVPPDVGTLVMVIFVNGNRANGYWIGCVQDEYMNFMVPGLAATKYAIDSTETRYPVAEYNKRTNSLSSDPTQIRKPIHPFAKILEQQGLLLDDIRGITTSSARRETPSAVFGISTPGPIDKQVNAKRGKVGKLESQVPNMFVSRLGGSTFVLDDGDDKFLRMTHASEGPPIYAAVEQGETGGNPTIPHNELVRIRTRTGHQILLHNSEDLIYIANSRGTTWIELTSNGKIDIYAEDSVSVHTKGDYNVTADKNINLTAKEDINITALNNTNIKSGTDFNSKSSNTNLTQSNTMNIKSATNKITASGENHFYSGTNQWSRANVFYTNPGASGAVGVASQASLAIDAIVAPRVPEHEPWSGHENLHNTPLMYTTSTDTFAKVKGEG